MSDKSQNQDAPITIKKYANRRLYNTATSSYVTLDHLSTMVKEGVDFVVYDAKSGDDITRSVLTQIIMEEESKGDSLLPISFLRRLISYYGDSLGDFVPRYLDLSMETFARNQEQMRGQIGGNFDGMFPFRQIEEMGKANMKAFQNAMDMFSPFNAGGPGGQAGGTQDNGAQDNSPQAAPPPTSGCQDSGGEDDAAELDALKSQLDAMQRQLNKIASKDTE
jgi:polyhydroxyalkanoate synthesis repressor PhaR